MAARRRDRRPSRPTRTTPARRRRTSSTSACPSARRPSDGRLLQPYKVATWDTIPEAAKDAEGFWYGDYYGVLSFEINTAVVKNVPKDWADLLKPEYKGQVALAGDPRPSNQAIQAVYAAALANGGSLDNVAARPRLLQAAQRRRQLRARHRRGGDRRLRRDADHASAGPTTGSPTGGLAAAVARRSRSPFRHPAASRGVYVQAISAFAPHPNAAKLWMEFLYSDEGQHIWLAGYCHPIRYEDLVARNAVPQELATSCPMSTGAVFPTLDQIKAATKPSPPVGTDGRRRRPVGPTEQRRRRTVPTPP